MIPDGRTPVLLSAHAHELLAADAAAILAFLERDTGCSVAEVAAQLARVRRVRRHRAVIRAADRAELTAGLRALVTDTDHPLLARSAQGSAPRIAFVFPGQGNNWPGLGAQFYERLPGYRAEADRCAAAFEAGGFASPLRYLTTAGTEFSQAEIQGAQFTHAVALARVWQSCGVLPDLTLGHSLGEVAAAYVAGTIELAAAVAVVAARADVVTGLPGRYGMAALGVTAHQAAELIADTAGWLELSVVNAGTSVLVSGDLDSIGAITEAVARRGGFAKTVPVDYPAHTSALEPLRATLTARLPGAAQFADSAVQFVGSATGTVVAPGTDFAGYWYANLRNTVRFDRAVGTAVALGAQVFVELSGHPALLYALADLTADCLLVGSGERDRPPVEHLSAAIATTAVADPAHRWAAAGGPAPALLHGFPNSPMRAERYWALPDPPVALSRPTTTVESWQPDRCAAAPAAPAHLTVVEVVLPGEPGGPDGLGAQLRQAAENTSTPSGAPEILVAVVSGIGGADAVEAAATLSEALGTGILGYADAIGPRCRDVWLVTSGGEQVADTDPPPVPAHAALAAMHRCVGFEYPDQGFHHLDLPRAGANAQDVLEVVLGGAGELALRGGAVYRRELGGCAPAAAAWNLDSGVLDEVVITGGSGTIGLAYARYLAGRGARRIVLLSRSGTAAAEVAALSSEHGTEVVSVACDITDEVRMAQVATEVAGAATLVVHAAGTAEFADRAGLTAAAFADMAAAKLTGLTQLRAQWPLHPECRILLCSSVTGVWGGKGVAGYAAANRMLDAMAAGLRADGLRCTAVRWGLWQGSEIVDAAEIARVERAGLRPMAPVPAIEASLYDHLADPLVLSSDPERQQMFFGARAAGDRPTPSLPGLPADPAAAVRVELAAVLKIADPATLHADASLFDLGLDSLLALDLRKRIKRSTGASVALAALLGGITVSGLIDETQKVDVSSD